MNALTRGGPNGTPKPIESHAHDPFRYIGDMLAWVHQAVAGEHEFLQALFDVVEGIYDDIFSKILECLLNFYLLKTMWKKALKISIH